MGRSSGGYTIIEVMIVLAISGALAAAAITVFHGSQADTQFNQTMQDMSSKLQSYSSQITSGTYPGSDTYTCSINTSAARARPQLATSGSTNEGCVFLGRTLQVQVGQGTFDSYVILGTRDTYNGRSDTGEVSTSIDGTYPTDDPANPTPGLDNLGNYIPSLIEQYTMGGLNMGSSKGITIAGATNTYNLVGIYSDLGSTIASGAGQPVISLMGYNFSGALGSSGALTTCIEESTCSATPLSQWNLCLTDGKQSSILQVKPGAGGVTTSVVSIASCP